MSTDDATPPPPSEPSLQDLLVQAAKAGRVEDVQRLVQSGACVNTSGRDRSGALTWMPLEAAARYGRAATVRFLLSAGADVNADGVLYYCAGYGNEATLRVLLDAGADVKRGADPDTGEAPLIVLVRWNYHDAVARLALLLGHPDIDVTVLHEDKTAEQWAREEGHTALADMVRCVVSSSCSVSFDSVFTVVHALWALQLVARDRYPVACIPLVSFDMLQLVGPHVSTVGRGSFGEVFRTVMTTGQPQG